MVKKKCIKQYVYVTKKKKKDVNQINHHIENESNTTYQRQEIGSRIDKHQYSADIDYWC